MTPNLEGSGKALVPICETIPGPTFSDSSGEKSESNMGKELSGEI